ncbi:hypothetical protein AB0K00_42350 [Dactylosporangium sp. NPDC049525]|uniref:hypothetical protein n=1 Tax=Dactylosporangium sp. NPDC049525 TaxID=3154730 RepID=UPI00342F12BA
MVFAAVGGAGAWAALADGKAGWTVVAAGVAAAVGASGPSVADWWRARAVEGARSRRMLAEVGSAEVPLSVAWLLHPQMAVVPFLGRGWLLQGLESWAQDRGGSVVRLVAGAGGVGKTRLARQLVDRLPNWDSVWVAPQRELAAVELLDDVAPGRWLLVVDYGETRDRAGLAALLCAAQRVATDGVRVRVLVLARTAGLWWETLSAAYPQQAHVIDALTVPSNAVDVPAEVEGYDPDWIVGEAVTAFAARLNRPVPTVPSRVRVAGTPVLRLHAEALVAVLGGVSRDGRFDVLDEVLRHEVRYWRGAARRAGLLVGDDPAVDVVLRQVAGVAALLGASDEDQVAGLVRRAPLLAGAEALLIERYVRWLRDLYPSLVPGLLGAIQLDLLAEDLAVQMLRGCTAAQRVGVLSALTVQQAVQALTVLARAGVHQPDADALIDVALSADVPVMTEAVLSIGVQFPGRFTPQIVELLATADLDLGWARRVAGRIPYPSQELCRIALALTTRIVAGLDTRVAPHDRAVWTGMHALRLAETARRA